MADTAVNAIPRFPLFTQRGELIPSVLLMGVLMILLVPLPTTLIDMLLAINLGVTILVLLVTLSARQALDFSVFPGLLLLLTLFRLALNVATTRQILVHGQAGYIVNTFGQFVVSGSLVVGLVIFLILIVIQFVVITKGAGRISEVAARFILDALPGKQMAIDAELNAGVIDEEQAKKQREHLMRETEFYGAMDGASKFVRGDAIAGVIITAVNLLGGIAIGLGRGLTLSQAVQTYSVLSIGDGLVSQIPALIVATASGILVTKATSQTSLGQEISEQFAMQPRPLYTGAAILSGLALIPGLPKIPFLLLAGILFIVARQLLEGKSGPQPAETEKKPEKPLSEKQDLPVGEFLQHDRAVVEIGARLIPLVEPIKGVGLLDRIAALRRDLGRNHGIWVPPIRIRSNLDQDADSYRILINGTEIGRGMLRPGKYLAIVASQGIPAGIHGEKTTDPTFGLPAVWIEEQDRRRATLAGCTVVDAASVLITHLGEIIKRHAHELLSREDLKELVDKVREDSPSVVEELIPDQLNMAALHRVVCLLLEERVPISQLARILESLSQHAATQKDPVALADLCRIDLGRTICEPFRDTQGRVRVIAIDPRLEMEMRRNAQEESFLLDAARLEKMMVAVMDAWRKAQAAGQPAALLTHPQLRRQLRRLMTASVPDLAVISYSEIPADMTPNPICLIRPEDVSTG